MILHARRTTPFLLFTAVAALVLLVIVYTTGHHVDRAEAAPITLTLFDPADVNNADGWQVVSFTGANDGFGPPSAIPYDAIWTASSGGMLCARSDCSGGPGPGWPGYETAPQRWVLQKTFTAPRDDIAIVDATDFIADGGVRVRVNGVDAGLYAQWNQPATTGSSSVPVVAGTNTIEIEVRDVGGPNWVRGQLDITMLDVSNPSLCVAGPALVNGGFEQPDVPGSTWDLRHQDVVDGWLTTASDGQMEFWNSGFGGVVSYEGGQHAELNANFVSMLYQDVDTTALQGVTLEWGFAHRGRAGNDTIALLIGAPGAEIEIDRFTTGNTAWAYYSGEYTVPLGQTTTRFGYQSVSAAGGNRAVGNFLDGITFGVPPCETNLSVTKEVASDTFYPGGPVEYTITVANSGSIPGRFDVEGASFEDVVPADIESVTWTCVASTGATCGNTAGSGNTINETFDLEEGASVTYTVSGTIAADSTATSIENTATITDFGTSATIPVVDTNPADDTSSVTIEPEPAEIEVTKTSSEPLALSPGGTVTYTVEVANVGRTIATGATVTDVAGDGIVSAGWTCSATGATCPSSAGSLPLNETIGSLPPGGVLTYEIDATLDDPLPPIVANTVTVDVPGGLCMPDGSAPPCSATVANPPVPIVSIVKEAGAPEAVPGEPVTYTIVARNVGVVDANGTEVSDPGAAGLDDLSWICSPDGATCPVASGDGPLAATIDTFPAGSSLTWTVTGIVADGAAGTTISNTASATPPDDGLCPDGTEPPCESTSTVTVLSPGIEVVKTSDAGAVEVRENQLITYEFTVENTGDAILTNVTVTDPMSGLSPIVCEVGAGDVIGTMNPADVVSCEATYTVDESDLRLGEIENTASVTGDAGKGVQITDDDTITLITVDPDPEDIDPGDVPTPTPTVTSTPTVTPTATPTATPTGSPTASPSSTPDGSDGDGDGGGSEDGDSDGGDSTSGEGEGPGGAGDVSGNVDAPTPAETGHGLSDSTHGASSLIVSLLAAGGLLGAGLALLRRQAR